MEITVVVIATSIILGAAYAIYMYLSIIFEGLRKPKQDKQVVRESNNYYNFND